MSPQLLRVCERLAHEGYAAVAPDLFWRFGGSDPDKGDEHYPNLLHADGLADIVECVGWLRAIGATKVGITGFCMGGGYAYLAALKGDVDAAVPFYGGGIAQHLGTAQCPLLAFFGGRDEWIPRDQVAQVEAAPSRRRRRLRRRGARLHARRLRQLPRDCGEGRVAAHDRVLRATPTGAVMEIRTLGKTGIQVSVQCLGAMMFGMWGNRDHDDCVKIIHHALDHGINFVDTADVYSQGESEEIVGKALKGRRDDVVLATKVHGQMGEGVNRQGNSRRWIRYEVEQSLRRLQTDHIDLYQIHRPDPTVDVEETLSVLTDLVREGKVRAIGSSTFPAEQIVEAQWVAERRGYERFRCEQPPYSILARGIERAVLPTCERYGMGVIVWSPLNGGWLTGKYKRGQEYPKGTRASWGLMDPPEAKHNQRKFDAIEQLEKVAADAGVSLTHLAIAWSIEHRAVTSTIIGPKTMDQLDDLLGAADVTLDAATLDRIDEIVAPGRTLHAPDDGYESPSLAASARRRTN